MAQRVIGGFGLTVLLLTTLASCSKMAPFQKEVFRAVDDKEVITLISRDELELSAGGTNLVCKYGKENDRLRITLNVMGTTQAVYYAVTPEGLRSPDGMVLYQPSRYKAVMDQVNAQRRQTLLNRSLIKASQGGDSRAIDRLIAEGAQIEATDDREATALITAIQEGHFQAVKTLLEHKANPNATNQDRITPLMLAVNTGGRQGFVNIGRTPEQDDIVQSLIEHRANLDAQEKQGYTALMLTMFRKNLEATKLLVKAIANRNLRDSSGKTVFDYAETKEEKAALRTKEEQQTYDASRTPTRTIGRYREVAPKYGLRGDEMRRSETIVTDVSLLAPDSNMDNKIELWFGEFRGEPKVDENQPTKTFLGTSRKEYYIIIPGQRNLMFLDPNERNQCYRALTEALQAWRNTFPSLSILTRASE